MTGYTYFTWMKKAVAQSRCHVMNKMSASIVAAVLLVLFLPGESLGCCMKVNVSSKQFRDEQGRSRLFQGLNVVRACMHNSG